MAVQLAQEFFLGGTVMAQSTAGTLNQAIMMRIKAIILSKFASKRSDADKEAWGVGVKRQ